MWDTGFNRDNSGQSVLTVSGRNVPTEYNVYYSVSYSVWVNSEEVLPEQSINLSQAYTYDANIVLGKNRERDAIRDALAGRLVRQVVARAKPYAEDSFSLSGLRAGRYGSHHGVAGVSALATWEFTV